MYTVFVEKYFVVGCILYC